MGRILFGCALLLGGIAAWCVAAVVALFVRDKDRIRKEDIV